MDVAGSRKLVIIGLAGTAVISNLETWHTKGEIDSVHQWLGILITYGLLGLLAEGAPAVAGGLAVLIPLGLLLKSPNLLTKVIQ